ncbi:MAG: DUF885 domain-containing protein [Pseudomonadota bacterium]
MTTRLALLGASFALILAGCGAPVMSSADGRMTASETRVDTIKETGRLNAWLEAKYIEAVSRSPQRSTSQGSRLNYDKWDDVSPESAEAELQIRRADIAQMRALFDPENLTAQGRLSYRLAEYNYERFEAGFIWRDHTYTFDQMRGAQSRIPSFLMTRHKIVSKADAEAYIARLKGIETLLVQHMANAERKSDKGIRPPHFTYEYVLGDARNIITGYPFADSAADGSDDSPLMADFRAKVQALIVNGTLTDADGSDLLLQAEQALSNHVGPTYKLLISFIENDRRRANTDDGAWKLPNGEAYYAYRLERMTTTDMSAGEIHALGLSEVDRIHSEMRAIMERVGFEGSLKAFFEFTRTDPQFFKPNTPEGKAAYLQEAEALIETMSGALPSVFNVFPEAELEVRAVEPFRERSAGKAFYSQPAPDGSRPGIYYANLYRMQDMPLYQMEALAYHEAVPGHHMQRAISQELTDIPKFRKFGGYTAYSEGWGLYSEFLPKEMGFYQDPYSDYGRLAMELWRAARLVVDTGIHQQKWTREEAIEYLLTNTPNPEGDCIKAIERYIVMPGQATAYKIGMNKILELRAQARETLGDAFDIRDFHDVVLKDGPVPLAILEENIEAWIAAKSE